MDNKLQEVLPAVLAGLIMEVLLLEAHLDPILMLKIVDNLA